MKQVKLIRARGCTSTDLVYMCELVKYIIFNKLSLKVLAMYADKLFGSCVLASHTTGKSMYLQVCKQVNGNTEQCLLFEVYCDEEQK